MADCVVLRPPRTWSGSRTATSTYELWAHGLALAGCYDVAVSEADVPPMQVQGPRALEVLAPLTAADLAALPRFRCVETTVAGVPAVVSATGWSREAGFEVYPLGSDRATEIWDAIAEAGEPTGCWSPGPT